MMRPGMQSMGFGVGIDLPWGTSRGFEFTSDGPGDSLSGYLSKNGAGWNHFFFAFQPRNRNPLRIGDYVSPWDKLYRLVPENVHRGLHHTLLNLGYAGEYPRDHIIGFTNEIIDRYGIEWVVEDLGIWSIEGKSLPYPLPPMLTASGLAASIKNVGYYRKRLNAPLSVEFPGFTDGSSLIFGQIDAFDFLNAVHEETGCLVTLDCGHILGYWYETHGTFDGLYDHLGRLPLGSCFELHLSGAQLRGGRFFDSHNGVLLPEQVDLAGWFMENCPNLKAVTYEDPNWDLEFQIIPQAKPLVDKLQGLVSHGR